MLGNTKHPTKSGINLGIKLFLAGLVSLAVSLTIALSNTADTSNRALTDAQIAKQTSAAIREAVVEACEKSGNPLREGLRIEKEEELAQQRKYGLKAYEEFFPGVPVQKLKRIRREANAKLRYSINVRYKEVDCKGVYTNK